MQVPSVVELVEQMFLDSVPVAFIVRLDRRVTKRTLQLLVIFLLKEAHMQLLVVMENFRARQEVTTARIALLAHTVLVKV